MFIAVHIISPLAFVVYSPASEYVGSFNLMIPGCHVTSVELHVVSDTKRCVHVDVDFEYRDLTELLLQTWKSIRNLTAVFEVAMGWVSFCSTCLKETSAADIFKH